MSLPNAWRLLGAGLWMMAGMAYADQPAFIPHKDAAHVTGEQLFTHICQGCHMPDAKGAQGAGRYPALASNPKLASAAYPAVMVIQGRGAMPPFGRQLTDQQIADVVNYVRTHFGNAYPDSLKAADVAAFRPSASTHDETH
jgi:mono/diheme cytochrome c family protein